MRGASKSGQVVGLVIWSLPNLRSARRSTGAVHNPAPISGEIGAGKGSGRPLGAYDRSGASAARRRRRYWRSKTAARARARPVAMGNSPPVVGMVLVPPVVLVLAPPLVAVRVAPGADVPTGTGVPRPV